MDNPLIVRASEELEINYRMQETTSAVALRRLSVSQRGCRFEDEPLTNDISVYSTSICYIICRYKLALKLCGCRPFFYHTLGNTYRTITSSLIRVICFVAGKVCNITGLLCVSKHVNYITKNPSEIGCKCPQLCNTITYLPQIPKIQKW